MIRNWRVFRVETLGRGIEQMKALASDPCDDLRVRAAPWKLFTDAKQATGARHRCKYGVGVQRLDRA